MVTGLRHLLLFSLCGVLCGYRVTPKDDIIFGPLDFSTARSHIRLVWPPLKLVSAGEPGGFASKVAKWPRSIFLAKTLPNGPAPWLAGPAKSVVLKSCPAALNVTGFLGQEPFVCENEAHVHAYITKKTSMVSKLQCNPHFIPLLQAWKAEPFPSSALRIAGPRNLAALAVGVGFETSVTPGIFMIIEHTAAVQQMRALDGYKALTAESRAAFSRYILFQIAFSLHVLGSIRCQHRDIAMGQMGHNLRYLQLGATQDPCNRAASCEGYCWRAQGSIWCFNRENTPLIGVIVKVFDFGKGVCDVPFSRWFAAPRVATAQRNWATKPVGVADEGVLQRSCGYMNLTDCPDSFPAPVHSLKSPYFERYLVDRAPAGACIMA